MLFLAMLSLNRTNSNHSDFITLIKDLDAYLSITDGEEHEFYNQFNKVDKIKHVIIANENDIALGCGAMKAFSDEAMEIKRMYTAPNGRKRGIATAIINELELWAKQLGYTKCVLETGKKQLDAIALYQKLGYQLIPNYGQYIGIQNSVCFAKFLD
jgi:putative acetyltransferase